jgi:hypothetical protein
MPFVAVVSVKRTKRVAVVIAGATVPRVGKQLVFVLVIANPVPAATRLHQMLRLAAQTAAGFGSIQFGWLAHLVFCSDFQITRPVKR